MKDAVDSFAYCEVVGLFDLGFDKLGFRWEVLDVLDRMFSVIQLVNDDLRFGQLFLK